MTDKEVKMYPVVAIIGRPNVGKSTLFNRIIGKRQAVTADHAGTTRDRLYEKTVWNSQEFILVDTAGIEVGDVDSSAYRALDSDVQEQVLLAIDEADLLLFLVDATVGPTSQDAAAIRYVQKSKKPFVVAANKYDSEKYYVTLNELYQLGVGEITPIAALTGRGTGDILDAITKNLETITPVGTTEIPSGEGINVAIAGRPNVGKSSLFNSLLGQNLAVVSSLAGTTRDFTISTYKDDEMTINFIDTAGIRKRGKVGKVEGTRTEGQIEKYSVLRSFRAIDSADIVLILIDPTEGLTAQDLHIAGYARDQYKGVVLVVNKWDLGPEGEEREQSAYLDYLHSKIGFLPYAPVLFVSAKTGKNVQKIPETIKGVSESRATRVATRELNLLLGDDILKKSPTAVRGVLPKINYITQADINPPTFIFFASHPEKIHFSYKRYLENRIRDRWGFHGTPIQVVFKRKNVEYTYDKKKKRK